MDFTTYFTDLPRDQRKALAEACKTSVGYLKQVAFDRRRCGFATAKRLRKETNLEACRELCPDGPWDDEGN